MTEDFYRYEDWGGDAGLIPNIPPAALTAITHSNAHNVWMVARDYNLPRDLVQEIFDRYLLLLGLAPKRRLAHQ